MKLLSDNIQERQSTPVQTPQNFTLNANTQGGICLREPELLSVGKKHTFGKTVLLSQTICSPTEEGFILDQQRSEEIRPDDDGLDTPSTDLVYFTYNGIY